MEENESKIDQNSSDQSKPFQERIDDIRTLAEENLRYTKNLYQSEQADVQTNKQEMLYEMLKQNLALTQEIYNSTQKIKRWIAWQKVWSILKLVMIAIPIVLALIYLPPLVQDLMDAYAQVLGFGKSADPGSLIKQITNQIPR